MKVCKVAIGPVETYGAETMSLKKDEEEKLRKFDREV